MADDTPAEHLQTFERQMDLLFPGRPSDKRWWLLSRDDRWEWNKLDNARNTMAEATLDLDKPVRPE